MATKTNAGTADLDPGVLAKLEAFATCVITDSGTALHALLVYVGDVLGLWSALSAAGPTTPAALAEATGTHERMVREWLAAQAASGYVTYDADGGTFSVPLEHDLALGAGVAGASQLVVSAFRSVDKVVDAMRTGKGLAWSDHHSDLFDGLERLGRPMYQMLLTTEWIPALEGIEARLTEGCRVADIGCGHGASTIVMAQTYPASTLTGFDSHAPSIDRARQRAREAGLADRVSFDVAPAQELHGEFDLMMFCECLHDMADPLGAARRATEVLAPGGTVLIVEPPAGDRLEDNLHAKGRWFYSASTIFCTPCSLADDGAALGAQAGEARTRAIFHEAGFSHFRRAAETPYSTVYEARVS